jgi:hypothetical protein
MARNIQFQVLRGVKANVPPDLSFGEMYFATDVNALLFGTPGIGVGYIQVGDTSQVNERLEQIALIMEGARRALVELVCTGKNGSARPEDFSPATIAKEFEETDSALS